MRLRTAGLALAVLLGGPVLPRGDLRAQRGSSYEQLQTFSGLLNQIRLNYVDTVTTTQLVRAAIDGMLRSLDPHSFFQTRAEAEKLLAWELGRTAGAGIVVEDVDGRPTVLAVLPGSPAARAGITAGDRLVSLNDTTVAGIAAKTLQARLLGAKGERVRLELERGPRLEPERFVVALKYDRLEPRAVGDVRKLDSITGYVAFHQFTVDAHEQLRAAFRRLLREQHARQVVLDLRRNPGGDLAAAVRVAAAFFPERTLVFRSEGRRPATDREFRTDRDGEFRDVPLVVLIDERTASAAEALAGSLQDHDRALVLGRRSFGKALIQQLLPVPPAGDAVWLTTARVVTPSGRVIQRSYRGLNAEQYFSQGGRAGAEADTLRVYRTAAGREVRGGGGIAPDVPLPAPPGIPVWLSVAADSGFDHAVADSVAATLPATPGARTAWLDASDEWRLRLVPPFLSRVRSRLGVAAAADSALERLIARHLAARVADVRWGPDARDELLVRSDPDVRAARTYFARLGTLLAGSAR